jgi:hypothetical protein
MLSTPNQPKSHVRAEVCDAEALMADPVNNFLKRNKQHKSRQSIFFGRQTLRGGHKGPGYTNGTTNDVQHRGTKGEKNSSPSTSSDDLHLPVQVEYAKKAERHRSEPSPQEV